jgi:hypothetical protein
VPQGAETCWSLKLLVNIKLDTLYNILLILLLLFILTANGVSPGGSGTTIRYNTQTTHITQNNTQRSNATQHTKQHTQ